MCELVFSFHARFRSYEPFNETSFVEYLVLDAALEKQN